MKKTAKERPVKNPNLPAGKVSTVIIGEKYADILADSLKKRDISIIIVPDNRNLQPGISGHADMSVLHCGASDYVCAKGMPLFVNFLTNRGINVFEAQKEQSPDYPLDIGLNACVIGEYVIHNEKYTDSKAKELLYKRFKPVNVNQGYSKCSVCVLSRSAVITSDTGIHKAAVMHGIEALLISPGFIELPGYNTGFIGGACGKLDADTIAFTGKLNNHPDKDRIENYISKLGLKIVYLTDRPCFDIGSILPGFEYTV